MASRVLYRIAKSGVTQRLILESRRHEPFLNLCGSFHSASELALVSSAKVRFFWCLSVLFFNFIVWVLMKIMVCFSRAWFELGFCCFIGFSINFQFLIVIKISFFDVILLELVSFELVSLELVLCLEWERLYLSQGPISTCFCSDVESVSSFLSKCCFFYGFGAISLCIACSY